MILSAPDPALDRAFASALLRLQHDAYRSQAHLIGDDRLVALAADEDDLPAWRGRYVVAWEGTQLLGAVAWRVTSAKAEIDRVMVDAAVRRRGIAAALVQAVLDEIGEMPAETFTGRENTPGVALYRRFSFEPMADEQASTGVWMTRLRRDQRQR
ncbi:MAG TPA: GNAT family N-acetyltransferase [Aeromicrobium sp.]|nr:GNAT family N-acetyltransferase [Aeromicrobium sp.]